MVNSVKKKINFFTRNNYAILYKLLVRFTDEVLAQVEKKKGYDLERISE